MTEAANPSQERAETLRRRGGQRLVVFASLTLVILAVVAALVLVQGINRQISDVLHNYEVRDKARELTIALSDAESSQRAYLLTSDATFLGPYRQATSAISDGLLTLRRLTQNDAEQTSRVQALALAISDKSTEMTLAIERGATPQQSRMTAQVDASERTMTSVRDQLGQFVGDENRNLTERNNGIEFSRRWLVSAIIAALAGAVLLAYGLLMRTQRQVKALTQSQDVLLSENEILEAHVLDRTQALDEAREHAEHERKRVEALLQDANHRIGNSLATVSSLLGLQLMRSTSEEVKVALEAARSRVHAVASAHRRLRLGDDLETANANEFLDAVLEDIASTMPDGQSIKLVGDIDEITIGVRDATTVGILVGELVTNAVKHAFPDGRKGKITVSLKRDRAGVPTLRVADDGVGISEQKLAGEGGLGSVIIKQLARQFGGQPQYERQADGGLGVSVPLPGIGAPTPTSSPE